MAPTFVQRLHDVAGTWGRPPDEPAKVAAGIAVVALLLVLTGRGRSLLGLGETPLPRRLFLWIVGFFAALLSIVYIAIYLRGGPRIIDATTYFLQGRALSHGDLSWPVGEPSASFRGRFLLYRELGTGDGVMGGIFPPGFPLLLALGFGVGAPMVVGPAIAAAIVVATYRLTHTIADDALGKSPHVEAVARAAALLSVFCGALRYHTADTMAHGATALGIALALDAALRRKAVVAGLLVGAVVATRPVSAAPVALVALGWLVLRAEPGTTTRAGASTRATDATDATDATKKRRALLRFVLAMVPGVLLLLVAQRSVTGAWLSSSQRMYYALSDGPRDCFRWGFGRAGCVYEHGEFVSARLPRGFGLVEALGTTLRRLRMHLLDVANLEPLALLVLVPLARLRGAAKRSPAVVAALALIGLHVVAYLPFYFDGNYPGGGARLFADLLPVEHALLAIGVARLVSAPRYTRAAFGLVALSLAGFAVHAAFDHLKLADRDGGRPMFEPDLVARANVTGGLVFVDTDHGFNLGHDPAARIKDGLVVARLRNDDRDRLLYDRLDHPTTYLYKFEIPPVVAGAPGAPAPVAPGAPAGSPPPLAQPALVPWAPAALGETLRFEAEAEWPVLAQSGGFAVPVFTEACASGSKALLLTPSPLEGVARATIAVPVPQAGRYAVSLRVVQGTKLPFVTTRGARLPAGKITLGPEHWDWIDVDGAACADLAVREIVLTPPLVHLELQATQGGVALDRVQLRRLP